MLYCAVSTALVLLILLSYVGASDDTNDPSANKWVARPASQAKARATPMYQGKAAPKGAPKIKQPPRAPKVKQAPKAQSPSSKRKTKAALTQAQIAKAKPKAVPLKAKATPLMVPKTKARPETKGSTAARKYDKGKPGNRTKPKPKNKPKPRKPPLKKIAKRNRRPGEKYYSDADALVLKRATTTGTRITCDSSSPSSSKTVEGNEYLNITQLVDTDLQKFMADMKVKPFPRRADECYFNATELTGLKDSNGVDECYTLQRGNSTFLLILGCGYSGTGATSKFFTDKVGVPVYHEYIRATAYRALEKQPGGVHHRAYGLVSWPATAMSLNYEPPCHDMELFLQVRHPLKVVNSHHTAKKRWNFDWTFGDHHFFASDPLPQRFKDGWHYFSDDVRVLLWWLSLNLLGEAQVRRRHGVAGGYGHESEELVQQRIYRMEDVFEGHDVEAFKNMISRAKGDRADFTSTLRDIDWEVKTSASLNRTRKVNAHARGTRKIRFWNQVDIRKTMSPSNQSMNTTSQTLQLEVVQLAQLACAHYGYKNCNYE